MRDEGDDPHADVDERINEEEAELSLDLIARAVEFGVEESLATGVGELELRDGC